MKTYVITLSQVFPDMAQASGRTDKIQSSFPKRTDLFKMQET